MKKIILGIALLSCTFVFSQTKEKSSSIRYGVKAGMNISSLTNLDQDQEYGNYKSKAKVGFNIGAFVNIPISESFNIQPELLYSSLGSKESYDYFIGDTFNGSKYSATNKINLDYLVIPVMFQYNFTPSFYLEAGPEFGFALGGKSKTKKDATFYKNGNSYSESESYTTTIKGSNLNTLSLGIGIGTGYYFTNNIGVTARYVAGLTNIIKDNDGKAVKNNVFQIGLAYKF